MKNGGCGCASKADDIRFERVVDAEEEEVDSLLEAGERRFELRALRFVVRDRRSRRLRLSREESERGSNCLREPLLVDRKRSIAIQPRLP